MSSTEFIRVALCTDGVYPQAMGGMQRHSRLLAEHLSRNAEIELHVIHPHDVGIFDASLGILEHNVQNIDVEKLYLRELKRYSQRVSDTLNSIQPDVILSQGFSVWNDLDKWGSRTIVHPHGLEMFQMISKKEQLLGWPFRKALTGIIRKSNTVVSLGGKLTTILENKIKGSPCQLAVIPNAVDVPERALPFPESSRPLQLMFVGRFAFNKGLDLLIDLARRLVQEGKTEKVHFNLAGDGPLLKEIKEKGVPENVTLHGRVSDEEMEALYETNHALILPTRFEGMPTVVLEAMARNRPIIVSDVGATAEQVGPNNGYLIPSSDKGALYDAVMSMLERDPVVWEKMGAYSYERSKELFSWSTVAQRFVDHFKRISQQGVRESR